MIRLFNMLHVRPLCFVSVVVFGLQRPHTGSKGREHISLGDWRISEVDEVNGDVAITNKEEAWPSDVIFAHPDIKMYSQRQRLDPACALALYQTTYLATSIFDANNITYWAGSGTLLGALRNKGIIPHDNDVDLQILVEDVPKLKSPEVQADLENNGLKLIEKYSGLWGIVNASLRSSPLNYDNDFTLPGWMEYLAEVPLPYCVDVFSMRHSQGKYTYVNDNSLYDKRAFDDNVTDYLVKMPFGSASIVAPNISFSEEYLNRVYGSDWKTTVNCGGTLHGCKTAEDKYWGVRHMAEPTGPLMEPKFLNLDVGERAHPTAAND